MSLHYNQNYTKEQVEKILNQIKVCIENNRFNISLDAKNRSENVSFISAYNIRTDKQKSILLGINVEDFCHSLQNKKTGFENEILYVFAPTIELYDADDKMEKVCVYIKFNLVSNGSNEFVVVISFHKANRKIECLFS